MLLAGSMKVPYLDTNGITGFSPDNYKLARRSMSGIILDAHDLGTEGA